MSILIKGHKMPKGCASCDYPYFDEGYDLDDYNWFCPFVDAPIDEYTGDENKRAPFCPLVEIPPHGRLIDADKLIEQCEPWKETEEQDDLAMMWNDGIDCCINEIKHHAPTVIESEAD